MSSALHQQFLRDLKAFATEIGQVQEMGVLNGVISRFESHGYRDVILLDIYSTQEDYQSVFFAFKKWIESQAPSVAVRLMDPYNPPSLIVGSALPAFAIWLGNSKTEGETAFRHLYQSNSRLYLKTFVSATLANRPAFIVEVGTLNWEGEGSIPDLAPQLDEILPTNWKSILFDRQCWNGIQSALVYMSRIVSDENKLLALKRNVQIQAAQISKMREQGGQTSDLNSALKSKIANWVQEAEKNIRSKYEDAQRPNIGLYATTAQSISTQLGELDSYDLAEKNERVGTKINEEYLNAVLQHLGGVLGNDFDQDILKFQAEKQQLIASLGQINNNRIPKELFKLDKVPLNIPTPQKIKDTYVAFAKNYQGEMVKKGKMEYFVAIRDYTGIIMVVGGLLSPLTIIANAADSELFKSMGVGLRVTIASLTFLMVLYGFFDLRKRIPMKRREELERELGKARELLFQESKKILADGSKEWASVMIASLRDFAQQLNLEIESITKSMQSSIQSQNLEERNKIEKQRQAMDLIQKRIANAERLSQDIGRTHRDKSPTFSPR
jgi:hypothetical protein